MQFYCVKDPGLAQVSLKEGWLHSHSKDPEEKGRGESLQNIYISEALCQVLSEAILLNYYVDSVSYYCHFKRKETEAQWCRVI